MKEHPGVQLFTVEEANQALPQVRSLLAGLRGAKKDIVNLQARVDIEEMTGGGDKVAQMLEGMESRVEAFHAAMKELAALGGELKDLDKGLFDFYSLRGNQVVYLCWQEGEESITHWHGLEEGFG